MDLEDNLESLSLENREESQSGKLWRLKVASNVFFVYQDEDGFGNAIARALNPTPHPYSKVFEVLNLDFGDVKLNGSVTQLRDKDDLKATMVMLDHLEPPVLPHVIYSVLTKIADAEHMSSAVPTIIAPFLVPASKLKVEGRLLTMNSGKVPLYGIQVGPETNVSRVIASKTQKPPPSLQIHYEPVACFLHLVRAANLPTSIIVGQRSQSPFNKALTEDIQTLCEIGELAASATGMYFQGEETKTNWIPTAKAASGGGGEPWRAFYG
ncbi:Period circadian protein, putative isoform 2 [Hibiscus syriacus]|uniref:Period circadian protein, putative isoform 2 n=1 Tax=Hibiscus syriacus TaxID=106335 RepID=A0A6A3CMB2_HIBSY|nr:uncharacterized protein LOC120164633 [Hibiscus syriacus]KAE8730540.1 Period circadian protein, putative isoform 2 [Hibiscus syriacus]